MTGPAAEPDLTAHDLKLWPDRAADHSPVLEGAPFGVELEFRADLALRLLVAWGGDLLKDLTPDILVRLAYQTAEEFLALAQARGLVRLRPETAMEPRVASGP